MSPLREVERILQHSRAVIQEAPFCLKVSSRPLSVPHEMAGDSSLRHIEGRIQESTRSVYLTRLYEHSCIQADISMWSRCTHYAMTTVLFKLQRWSRSLNCMEMILASLLWGVAGCGGFWANSETKLTIWRWCFWLWENWRQYRQLMMMMMIMMFRVSEMVSTATVSAGYISQEWKSPTIFIQTGTIKTGAYF